MLRCLLLPTTCLVLALAVAGSAQFPLGQTAIELSFTNTSSRGSQRIPCTVWRPDSKYAKPWPLVLLLHGHGFVGKDYKELGKRLSTEGYLVVAPNNARTDGWLQGLDALALPAALGRENQRKGSVLESAIDLRRRAVLGHSMGGANAVRVLAEDHSWSLGIAVAPLIAPLKYPPLLRDPLVLIGASKDSVTPWRSHLLAIRNALSKKLPAWTMSIWDDKASHLNVAFRGYPSSTRDDDAIFDASYRTISAALRRWLLEDASALDAIVGMAAHKEAHLAILEHRFLQPEHYALKTAAEFRLHVAGPQGIVLELAAFGRAELATPFGKLGLSPASLMMAPALVSSGLQVTSLSFLRKRRFRGLKIWFQSLSTTLDPGAPGGLRFGRVLRGELGR